MVSIQHRNLLTHTYDLEGARRVHARLTDYLEFIQAIFTALRSMTLADLQPEDRRICGLVLDEATRCMAGHRAFSLYLVGSRATGEAWPSSDFDFVIDAGEALPGRIINPMRESLELLPVGYGIDLVDWNQCSDQFRELAGPQRVALTS